MTGRMPVILCVLVFPMMLSEPVSTLLDRNHVYRTMTRGHVLART